MMKLNKIVLSNKEAWLAKGYALPEFDYEAVRIKTLAAPSWIHFGAGNIFRAFQANAMQTLLNSGLADTGLIVAEGYDEEIIEKIYQPHDHFSILATLFADETVKKTVVASVMEALIMKSEAAQDFARLKEIFVNPSLQMATFTITEKGYSLTGGGGQLMAAAAQDMERGPAHCQSYMGMVASLLYERYQNGAYPLAMVSMDNCSHNGEKLQNAVDKFAKEWQLRGYVPAGFVDYINNSQKLAFPWTMIDKITPRPDETVGRRLCEDGIEGLECIETSKHTYIGAFVNAESCEYLVIEDAFPNGRPKLEAAGFIFTDRETVDKVERMKVCTCLNPLHTALAVFGCLLNKKTIAKAMQEPCLKHLVERIGYEEGLPVVVHPGVLEPKAFLDAVLTKRLINPFIPDTPQRIATDTSQKLAIRYGNTMEAYEKDNALDVMTLKMIPLVIAGWCRYLMRVDDNCQPMTPSPDPRLAEMTELIQKIPFGTGITEDECGIYLKPIMEKTDIFGVDLYKIGLASVVVKDFTKMIQGPGAVKKTLTDNVFSASMERK